MNILKAIKVGFRLIYLNIRLSYSNYTRRRLIFKYKTELNSVLGQEIKNIERIPDKEQREEELDKLLLDYAKASEKYKSP